MWRITREALVEFGFHMKTIGVMIDKPMDPTVTSVHINPLEFLDSIINFLRIALKIISMGDLCPTGYIISLLSDNSTALSWMHVAATTPQS
jgi:hypothetical protein